MNKESKESLAKMFAFMNRMDNHATMDEAKHIEKKILKEGMFEDDTQTQTQGKSYLCPMITDMNIEAQKNNKTILHITISPLMTGTKRRLQDIYGIRMIDGGLNDDKNKNSKSQKTEWIDIIVPVVRMKVPDPFANQAQNNGEMINGDENTTANDNLGDLDDDGLGDFDDDGLGDFDDDIEDNAQLNESNNAIDDFLDDDDYDLGASDDNLGASDDNLDANTNGNTTAKVKKIDAMKKWFLTTYVDIIKNIFNVNGNVYNPKYKDELLDGKRAYNMFLSTPTNINGEFQETDFDDFQKEIYKLITSGDWDAALGKFPVLNWESLVYGKTLSIKNQARIFGQFNKNPNARVSPTFVNSPITWERDYGRQIKDDEVSNGYEYWANPLGILGKKRTRQNIEALGHNPDKYENGGTVKNLAGRKNGKKMKYTQGFDISQTELIDPSKPDPLETLPGLKNNFTGELNDLAIADRDQRKAEYEEKLEQAKEVLADEKTLATITDPIEQAKLANDALYQWLINVSGSDTLQTQFGDYQFRGNDVNIYPIKDFVDNLFALGEHIAYAMQLSKPSDLEGISYFIAKVISHWLGGIGDNLIERRRQQMKFAPSITVTYKDFKNWINHNVYSIIQNMYRTLAVKVIHIKNIIKKAVESQNNVNNSITSNDVNTTQDVDDAVVTENIEKLLKKLLF